MSVHRGSGSTEADSQLGHPHVRAMLLLGFIGRPSGLDYLGLGVQRDTMTIIRSPEERDW